MSGSTCPNVLLVEAWRDGRLAPSDVASIERHVHTCAVCSEHAADLERIGAALRDGDPTPTPLEHRRARAALLRAAAAPATPRSAPRRGMVALAAAAVMIAGTAVAAVGLPRLLADRAPGSGTSDTADTADSADAVDTAVRVPSLAPPATPSSTPTTESSAAPPETPPAPVAPVAPTAPVGPTAPAPSAVLAPPVAAPPSTALRAPPPRSRPSPTAPEAPAPASSRAARSRALHDAVEAIERGDYGQASRHLDEARTDETDPERAELATHLQAVALQRAGRLDEARAVAREYLRRYPDGRFVSEARRIADGR